VRKSAHLVDCLICSGVEEELLQSSTSCASRRLAARGVSLFFHFFSSTSKLVF